ncbi:MAG: tetratricopeptide repeat protein [Planctomycetota bacterium]|jgi:tetratricopeptide (TPR) repeat protein
MLRSHLPATVLAGLLLAGVAAAGESAGQAQQPQVAPAAAPAPAPAPSPAPEEQPPFRGKAPMPGSVAPAVAVKPGPLVLRLYKAIEGPRQDFRPLGGTIDAGELLTRAVEGLGDRLPAVWMQATRKRLGGAGEMVGAARAIVPARAMIIKPRVTGSRELPDGGALVTVRFYAVSQRGGPQTVWHQVLLSGGPTDWRIADIEVLETGERLSYLAVSQLTDPGQDELPRESGSGVALLLATWLLPGLLAALILGLLVYFVLVRPRSEEAGRTGPVLLMWVLIVAPALAGTVLFFSGLMDHLDRDSAVEEFSRRGVSRQATGEAELRLHQGRNMAAQENTGEAKRRYAEALLYLDEGALAPDGWPQNRRAMVLRARTIASQERLERSTGKVSADYVNALAALKDPPLPAASFMLSDLAKRQGDWAGAARAMVAFGEITGEDAFVYCRAAQYFAEARDRTSAENMLARARKAQAFDNVRDEDEFDHIMLFARAAARAQFGRAKESIEDLKRILEPFKDDVRNYFPIGQQVLQVAISEQFKPLRSDPDFQKFVKGLQAQLEEIYRRHSAPPRPEPGGVKR